MPNTDPADPTDPTLDFVQRAAAIAAQRVAAIHRRRLVTQTFLVALFAAAAVSLPVALIANHQRATDSAANSQYNCGLLTEVGDVLHDFIQSDARLRFKQQHYAERGRVIAGFERIIPSKVLRRLLKRSERLDASTQAYWRDDLLPRITELADINCKAVLTTGGPDVSAGER